MNKFASMTRVLAIGAFALICLAMPTKQAEAACTAPAGVAGEIIYNSSNNIIINNNNNSNS